MNSKTDESFKSFLEEINNYSLKFSQIIPRMSEIDLHKSKILKTKKKKMKDKIHFEEFIIQKRKIILCFRITKKDDQYYIIVGMSTCNPEDKFNKDIGRKIAQNRTSLENKISSKDSNLVKTMHQIYNNNFKKTKKVRKFYLTKFNFSTNISRKLILDFAIDSVKRDITNTPEKYIACLTKNTQKKSKK